MLSLIHFAYLLIREGDKDSKVVICAALLVPCKLLAYVLVPV